MDYVVKETDTLEGIAASHDCTVGELLKLNRMHSRMVFAGQHILVPAGIPADCPAPLPKEHSGSNSMRTNGEGAVAATPVNWRLDANRQSTVRSSAQDSLLKGPGGAVRSTSAASAAAVTTIPATRRAHPTMTLNLEKSYSLPIGKVVEITSLPPEILPHVDEVDKECLQRFLKIKVKQITESDGTVTGTLLVTPNCLMFDPDMNHPLVMENGSDLYGMVANMEDIVSVSMYHQFTDVTGSEKARRESVLRPSSRDRLPSSPLVVAAITSPEPLEAGAAQSKPQPIVAQQPPPPSGVKFIGGGSSLGSNSDQLLYGMSAGTLLDDSTDTGGGWGHQAAKQLVPVSLVHLAGQGQDQDSDDRNLSSSDLQQLPSIVEEERERRESPVSPVGPLPATRRLEEMEDSAEAQPREKRRTVSDLSYSKSPEMREKMENTILQQLKGSTNSSSLSDNRTQTGHFELEPTDSVGSLSASGRRSSPSQSQNRTPSPSSPFSRYSPSMARKSFTKLGRTLSSRASSLKETVASGAQQVATGTQKVTHGVVTHTRSAADHIQTNIQTRAKRVASVGQELLQEGQAGVIGAYDQLKGALTESLDQPEMTPKAMRREKSLATLESLRQKTQQAREQSQANLPQFFGCEEMPAELAFHRASEMPPTPTPTLNQEPLGTPPDPPFYMTVRVDRRKRKKRPRLSPANRQSSTSGASSLRSSLSSFSCLDDEPPFGNRRKREFWFAVPRQRVDTIYHFLLHWSPEKYGQEEANTADETNSAPVVLDHLAPMFETEPASPNNASHEARTDSLTPKQSSSGGRYQSHPSSIGAKGFIVLDSGVDDSLAVLGDRGLALTQGIKRVDRSQALSVDPRAVPREHHLAQPAGRVRLPLTTRLPARRMSPRGARGGKQDREWTTSEGRTRVLDGRASTSEAADRLTEPSVGDLFEMLKQDLREGQWMRAIAALKPLNGREGRTQVEGYFHNFEFMTEGWSNDRRVSLLVMRLEGHARLAHGGLSNSDKLSYEAIKSRVLENSANAARARAQNELLDGIPQRHREPLSGYGLRILGTVRDSMLPGTPKNVIEDQATGYLLHNISDPTTRLILTSQQAKLSYDELLDKAVMMSEMLDNTGYEPQQSAQWNQEPSYRNKPYTQESTRYPEQAERVPQWQPIVKSQSAPPWPSFEAPQRPQPSREAVPRAKFTPIDQDLLHAPVRESHVVPKDPSHWSSSEAHQLPSPSRVVERQAAKEPVRQNGQRSLKEWLVTLVSEKSAHSDQGTPVMKRVPTQPESGVRHEPTSPQVSAAREPVALDSGSQSPQRKTPPTRTVQRSTQQKTVVFGSQESTRSDYSGRRRVCTSEKPAASHVPEKVRAHSAKSSKVDRGKLSEQPKPLQQSRMPASRPTSRPIAQPSSKTALRRVDSTKGAPARPRLKARCARPIEIAFQGIPVSAQCHVERAPGASKPRPVETPPHTDSFVYEPP